MEKSSKSGEQSQNKKCILETQLPLPLVFLKIFLYSGFKMVFNLTIIGNITLSINLSANRRG